MSKINPTGTESLINRFANSRFGKFIGNPAASAAVAIATTSNITKDGVNCIYYVTQSLNNERIPEDQRKFVAGLDLANGILNVGLQLGVTTFLTKLIADMFDKYVEPKYFTEEKYKEIYTDYATRFKPGELMKKINKEKGFARTGFCLLGSLISLQVIVKRIVVPFISTPMASIFRDKFEKIDKKDDDKEENKNCKNKSIDAKI